MMSVTTEISKAFNKNALEYERFAKVQQEIGSRLFERLEYLNISPRCILDLGCGPGYFSSQLTLKYPHAQIVGLDLAHEMLIQAKGKQNFNNKWELVTADMVKLPFANGLFDLVFANQVIHWSSSISQLFQELNRVMNVNGCLMFTTLGPDTFKELKKAWFGDPHAHVNQFIDMHDLGDLLMDEYFLDPVMDMEKLAIHYKTLPELLHSLKHQGVKNINPKRNQGLTSRKSWNQFEKFYASMVTEEGKYPLSYEVIYGQAWKGMSGKTEKGVETWIPVSHIAYQK